MRISRDELVILSFPGPDRSIRLDDLAAGRAVSRRYRNRRIGEFLKELDLTEGAPPASQDPEGDGGQRLAAAGVRDRR